MNEPKLFVFSAPSGCGKTTIAHAILQRHPEMMFSVSATSRPKRPNEVDGKDYFFISLEEFMNNIRIGALVEWEEIYGNYYGTLRHEVERALNSGFSMVFDIDVKGALSIKRHYPEQAVLIFIEPPSLNELIHRLKNRKTEDSESLKRRIERVPMEMEQRVLFDEHAVNDNLEKAIADVDAIIKRYSDEEQLTQSV
ncbi:MAG: guanylate kinase [Ignavibacteriae bacterium]|nr:guanylate kinase [Ignavibacteriota bacterium]